MTAYAEVRKEIRKLEKQAVQMRKAAVIKVIAAIKKQIAEFDLTALDLGFFGRGKAAGKVAKAKRPKAPPKYADPKTGKTWNGIGKPPVWIAQAKRREDFLIERAEKPAKGRAPAADKRTTTKPSKKRAGAAKPASAKPKAGLKRAPAKKSAPRAKAARKTAGGASAPEAAAAA